MNACQRKIAASMSALPEQFTVYRGQDVDSQIKYSWTFDIGVAEGFARGHRGIKHLHPVILAGKTKKSDVAFYEGDRQRI